MLEGLKRSQMIRYDMLMKQNPHAAMEVEQPAIAARCFLVLS